MGPREPRNIQGGWGAVHFGVKRLKPFYLHIKGKVSSWVTQPTNIWIIFMTKLVLCLNILLAECLNVTTTGLITRGTGLFEGLRQCL